MASEHDGLSPDQAAVLRPEVRVVEAAPGAGKTRAIVARFADRANASDFGVALLSFTNAAVDEAKRRCASSPELLAAPHFVGTIDAFLHRFIVTPSEVRRLGRLPTYRPAWDDLPDNIATVRLHGVVGAGIPLSAFRISPGGALSLPTTLGWPASTYRSQVDGAGRLPQLMARASAVISGLNNAGVFDAATARIEALRILAGEDGQALLDRLATRFGDVLVDEAQDCDEPEYGILRLLRDRGTAVVVVADPDQAIFEFRGGDPGLFAAFKSEHDPEAIIELTTNHRSTTEVCRAVSVLRSVGGDVVAPHEEAECAPVFILSGPPAEQGAKFRTVLQERGFASREAIVIAHAHSDAMAVTGNAPTAVTSSAAGNRLLVACTQLRPGRGDPASRLAAVRSIEDILLSLIDWPDDLVAHGRERKLAELDRRRDWLRKSAGVVAGGLHLVTSRDEFGSRARHVVRLVLDGLQLPTSNLGMRVKKPAETFWDLCHQPATDDDSLAVQTIHGVKGTESAAVLVALPDTLRTVEGKSVLDNIDEGVNTEARRVLYVGASRATTLLAFGAGMHADRLAGLLDRGGVNVHVK